MRKEMKNMKIAILTLMAAAFLLAQDKDTKQSKDASKSEPPKDATSSDPVLSVIPKGATQVEPNLYRYTDPQGKTWFYRRFPSGVSKWEDKPAEQRAVQAPLAAVVRDLGDSIEFQRTTPFGISKWVRKKTELTDEEKELLAADEAKRTVPSKDSDKTAPADKSKDKQEKQ
jgi:hypothetical protein